MDSVGDEYSWTIDYIEWLGGPAVVRRVRIALVTARQRPGVDVDVDMPLLSEGVASAGAEVVVAAWDEPGVDWTSFDLAVIRSTWDYAWRVQDFFRWVDACGSMTRLANAPEVLRWNVDKRYLTVLAERSIPVVATRYLQPSDPLDLPGDHEYVIKPAIGAGARLAARYRPEDRDEACAHLRRIFNEGLTAMIQPYLREIDTAGERALVFMQGQFLHAIRKGAVLAADSQFDQRREAHPGTAPWSPKQAELALAARALAAIPGPPEPLYARVDLVGDPSGEPTVMELELIEPNLFLAVHPQSVPAVSRAIVQAADSMPGSIG